MKICTIFAENLYAIHYSDDKINIYRKTIELWTDVEYLFNFLSQQTKDVQPEKIPQLISEILRDIKELDELMLEFAQLEKKNIEEFFRPLSNSEYTSVSLSRQKARLRKSHIRIYAIRIESGRYLITGGALKFTQRMQEREHTNTELIKLDKVREWLKSNGVFDNDSFYELYYEERDEK